MATEDTAVSLKFNIVVDKKKNRVLFAESGKDFVDFIIHILYLPLGAVSSILSDTSNFGSLGTLQEGIKNLDPKFFGGSTGKEYVLNSAKALYRGKKISQLLPEASFSKPHSLYKCRESWQHIYFQEPCMPGHGFGCCSEITVLPLQNNEEVFKGSEAGYTYMKDEYSTFMVMDDLTVRASSATAAFSLLADEFPIKDFGAIEKREVSFGPNEVRILSSIVDKFCRRLMGLDIATAVVLLLDGLSIKDVSSIEKREVIFGTNEAIKLLKASMSSKTVLTDVFLTGGPAVKAEK